MAWVGWFRRRGVWKRICEHGDVGECHRRLLALTPPDTGLNCCLTGGAAPVELAGRAAERDRTDKPPEGVPAC